MKDSTAIMFMLHLHHTEGHSRGTMEKQPTLNWKLFGKTRSFGLGVLHQAASTHVFVLGCAAERSNQKTAKDSIFLPLS